MEGKPNMSFHGNNSEQYRPSTYTKSFINSSSQNNNNIARVQTKKILNTYRIDNTALHKTKKILKYYVI